MQMTKKVLSIVLAVMMVVSMMSVMAVTANAASGVAKIGDTYYDTLEEAFAAANDGDTITLLGDVTITAPITVDKAVTFDFDGNTVTNNGTDYAFKVDNKAVTFKDGTIDGTGRGIRADGTNGVVTLGAENEALTVAATGRALGLYTGSSATLAAGSTLTTSVKGDVTVFISKNTSFTVNGTVTQTCAESDYDNNAISGNGNAHQHDGTTLTINDGAVVSSATASAIYQPQDGALVINGGSITGPTAVYVKSGTATINGGTLTGNGTAAPYGFFGNGGIATGDALVVDNCNYPGGSPTVDINSGTFNSSNAKGIGSYSGNTATTLAPVNATTNAITIADDEKWVDDGNGGYNLVKKDYVCQINSTKYETLDAAIAAAADGDTITVLADTTITSATVGAGKAVTLDCADKTVTVTPWGFVNNGTLTVTGTTGGLTGAKGLVDNYGTLNITGGVYTTTAANPAFYNNNDGNVINVSGGTINAAGNAIVNNNGTTNISGGTINGTVVMNETIVASQTAADAVNFTGGTINGVVSVGDADGTFTMSGTAAIAYDGDYNALEITAGTANLNGGTITATDDAYGVFIVGDNSKLVVDGATISAEDSFAISSNGTAGNEGYEIEIKSGSISSNVTAIYQQNDGDLTISGGNISGATALYIKSGDVTISGGTFNGTGAAAAYNFNGNGANSTGDAIVVDNCNYPGGAPTVTISGGTFNSDNGVEIGSYYGSTATELATVTATSDSITIADDEKWVDDGNGGYNLVKKGLQEYADTAYGLSKTLDFVDHHNQAINVKYKASLLGVQIRNNADGGYQYGDGTDALRFIAAVDNDIIAGASDYGFIITNTSNNKSVKKTCKGTTHSTIELGEDDPNTTFFTAAVYNIQNLDQDLKVEFYIEKNGDTATAKYTKDNTNQHHITTNYNAVYALANKQDG